jgi:polyisoprenoid-binding protein YceI
MYCGTHPMNQQQVCGFDARGSIKRSDCGINYGLPAVGDEVTLLIGAEAIKAEG